MLWAAGASVGVIAASALARQWWVLGAGMMVLGALDAVFLLARQSYLAEHTPPLKRARAMATLGGLSRIGILIGPFAGSALIHLWGLRAVFWMAAGIAAIVWIIVLAVPDLGGDQPTRTTPTPARTIIRDHRRLLATVGMAVLVVGAVRAVRNMALPLWGDHLGLPEATTTLIFGLSGLVDAAFFYPSGKVMDKHGRSWVAVPFMVMMGSFLMVLPTTSTTAAFAVVAMAIGFANSLGTGIVMTLGADTAPPDQRAEFLGVWRLLNDTGGAGGPTVVSAAAALGALAIGIVAIGALGLVAAVGFGVWVPRWTIHANHTTRRAAGIEPPRRR
jgi:MFS family permease